MTPTKAELIKRYGEPDDCAEASDATNADRAEWAKVALQAFGAETGQDYGFDDADAEVIMEVGGDLICNLLHLATMVGVDADDLIARGLNHFTAEVGMGYDEDDEDEG